jgi:hypothetical protein
VARLGSVWQRGRARQLLSCLWGQRTTARHEPGAPMWRRRRTTAAASLGGHLHQRAMTHPPNPRPPVPRRPLHTRMRGRALTPPPSRPRSVLHKCRHTPLLLTPRHTLPLLLPVMLMVRSPGARPTSICRTHLRRRPFHPRPPKTSSFSVLVPPLVRVRLPRLARASLASSSPPCRRRRAIRPHTPQTQKLAAARAQKPRGCDALARAPPLGGASLLPHPSPRRLRPRHHPVYPTAARPL